MGYGSDGRTWAAFGTRLGAVGYGIFCVMVYACVLEKQISILPTIVGIVSLIIGILGTWIASWDKDQKIKMLRIDPKLDYHFFLTFRGLEEEIKDLSRMEEVLIAFDEGREAWNLKIVPPMGTLSEWRGYYDEKENAYVTEATFVREEEIQKWALLCEYDGMVKMHRSNLKKIIVNKKKASFDWFCRVGNNKQSSA